MHRLLNGLTSISELEQSPTTGGSEPIVPASAESKILDIIAQGGSLSPPPAPTTSSSCAMVPTPSKPMTAQFDMEASLALASGIPPEAVYHAMGYGDIVASTASLAIGKPWLMTVVHVGYDERTKTAIAVCLREGLSGEFSFVTVPQKALKVLGFPIEKNERKRI